VRLEPGHAGTYSIVAADPETGELGVAVQSKYLAVGALVPYARAGVGAIATQAHTNPTYGPRGLALMGEGVAPAEVIGALVGDDDERNVRQVGIVNTRGHSAAHTGKHCYPWAGHITGQSFSCQGNMLAGERVVTAMAEAFQAATGDLAGRLVTALRGAQGAGGDWRGMESSALLVVKAHAGPKGLNDRFIDLRVDHHTDPLGEIGNLLVLHRERFQWVQREQVDLRNDFVITAQVALRVIGYYEGPITARWDAKTRRALRAFCDDERLLEPELENGTLSVEAFGVLRRRYASAG
jgi:uncharacterized Ntn-hydrolase superfamily protein